MDGKFLWVIDFRGNSPLLVKYSWSSTDYFLQKQFRSFAWLREYFKNAEISDLEHKSLCNSVLTGGGVKDGCWILVVIGPSMDPLRFLAMWYNVVQCVGMEAEAVLKPFISSGRSYH